MPLHHRLCSVCQTPFSTYRESGTCCSRKCGQNYRTVAATIPCATCGVLFLRRKPGSRFCGGMCYGKYRSASQEIAETMRRKRDFFATAEELEDLYHGCQMTQDEIAAHLHVSQKKVCGLMRHYGIITRPQKPRDCRGALNHFWKGGKIRMGKYRYVLDPDHPNATKNGYVAEHIKIITEAAGRFLVPGECVHHLDGDKENNTLDNLFITTHEEHGKLHRELETIAFALFRAHLIGFRDGHYILNEKLVQFAQG